MLVADLFSVYVYECVCLFCRLYIWFREIWSWSHLLVLKPWSITTKRCWILNEYHQQKKHNWNETIIIMSFSIGTVYSKPWFWRKVFKAHNFFAHILSTLSTIFLLTLHNPNQQVHLLLILHEHTSSRRINFIFRFNGISSDKF